MDAVPGWGHCPSRGPGARHGPVDREPRPRRTCDLASEGSHRRRRMAVLARAPELLPRSPPPARPAAATGCEGSALTLVSRAQLPVLRNGVASGRCGHLRMRLLLSFHFFLCLSSPAGDGLQRPFHLEMLPLHPTPHGCTASHPPSPPPPHGEAAEWPALGSWQRFRRFGRIKRGSEAGGQAGLQGEGVGSELGVTAQAWRGGT